MSTEFEHLHVMINHVPILGVAFVCVPLLYSVIRNDKHTLLLSLGVVIALALAASVTMWTGEEAMDRFMSGDLTKMMDEPGTQWMHEHAYRAERAAFMTYMLGVLAAGGYVALWKRPKWQRAIAAAMLVLCVLNALLYVWVADAGGRIRHPEFRDASHPAPLVAHEEDHDE
ncbi:MAG: hypothetical protein GC159_19220 [Phycisphaera sp.]|nr:hypothetical protein [Phycisphaera sp.]